MGSDSGMSGWLSKLQTRTRSLAFPKPVTRNDSVSVVDDNFPVMSRTLFPSCVAMGSDQICGFKRAPDMYNPDDLSAGLPEDRDGFDWQVSGLEAQLGGERRDRYR